MKRLLMVGLLVVAVLGIGGWRLLEHRADTAAGRAALEQYQQRTGAGQAHVGWMVRYGDCAIVALQESGQRADVAVKKVGPVWVTGRSTEEEGVSFDSDDVGSEDECLDVANSAGPLTNGLRR